MKAIAAIMAGLAVASGAHAVADDQPNLADVVRSAHQNTWADVTRITGGAQDPGPVLWKLTRGGFVVWVLGILEDTPQNLDWDKSRVRRVLSGAMALENALARPGKTVALVPFGDWMRKNGVLDRLQADGVSITSPRDGG